jgi:FPC/CPF motif-containing protein YcgG
MKDELMTFIGSRSFPCIMAKAVAKTGHLELIQLSDFKDTQKFLNHIYSFVDHFRQNPRSLHSFVCVFDKPDYFNLNIFEQGFWRFLEEINLRDKELHLPDPLVDSDPKSKKFSFSLKSEAFFILLLHPQSPRWSRRFHHPAIVYNPHKQFENLRAKGIFEKVRDLTRKRDKELQGSINPMLSDFGEETEVLQYTGMKYDHPDEIPFLREAI